MAKRTDSITLSMITIQTLFSETNLVGWLSLNVNTAEFIPREYNIFRLDRPDTYGGVLLAFKAP